LARGGRQPASAATGEAGTDGFVPEKVAYSSQRLSFSTRPRRIA
jgi:hypothetical protein